MDFRQLKKRADSDTLNLLENTKAVVNVAVAVYTVIVYFTIAAVALTAAPCTVFQRRSHFITEITFRQHGRRKIFAAETEDAQMIGNEKVLLMSFVGYCAREKLFKRRRITIGDAERLVEEFAADETFSPWKQQSPTTDSSPAESND